MAIKKDTAARAAALKYHEVSDRAPKVIAKGRGHVAEEIIEIAEKYDITIKEDPDLIEILYKLDLNEAIPPETYTVVAEILSFVYLTNEKYKARYGGEAKDGKIVNQPEK